VTIEGAFSGIAVDGRPADCVKLAVSQLLPRMPDLVISGMNSGVNVGINVIYSGTVAAAVEAAFLGLPSIAVSMMLSRDVQPPAYPHCAKLARETIEQILEAGLSKGQCVSINLPPLKDGQAPTGTKVARQCTNAWTDDYEKRTSPRGVDYFWNSSVFRLVPSDADTDTAGVRDGYITVTPLQFDLTNYPMLRQYEQHDWTRRKKTN
jgi:5'-nucleotidase